MQKNVCALTFGEGIFITAQLNIVYAASIFLFCIAVLWLGFLKYRNLFMLEYL